MISINDWEYVGLGYQTSIQIHRLAALGGWFITISGGAFFYPDPEHKWHGNPLVPDVPPIGPRKKDAAHSDDAMIALRKAWESTMRTLSTEVQKSTFDAFISTARTLAIDEGDVVVIGMPSRFAREFLEKRYSDMLRSHLRSHLGSPNIQLRIVLSNSESPPTLGESSPNNPPRKEPTMVDSKDWELIGEGSHPSSKMFRLAVPEGWFVQLQAISGGAFFYPDPNNGWHSGALVPRSTPTGPRAVSAASPIPEGRSTKGPK